ncbi:hypothetical protein NKI25_16220 [Mesorhizobium sp. M0808]|uniref:hypothetical protein n=1 Tax=Mesorhizobium sp. M0808 TaxID=2957002 RepID=UPI0033394D17
MEDELLDYATVCATGLIGLVIALLFGWNFMAALILGMLDRCRTSRCNQIDPRKIGSTLNCELA